MPHQPLTHPLITTVTFEIDDLEAPWTFTAPFDFIFERMTVCAFADTAQYFRQAYDNLVPGGWAECLDICNPICSDDGTLREDSDLLKWFFLNPPFFLKKKKIVLVFSVSWCGHLASLLPLDYGLFFLVGTVLQYSLCEGRSQISRWCAYMHACTDSTFLVYIIGGGARSAINPYGTGVNTCIKATKPLGDQPRARRISRLRWKMPGSSMFGKSSINGRRTGGLRMRSSRNWVSWDFLMTRSIFARGTREAVRSLRKERG